MLSLYKRACMCGGTCTGESAVEFVVDSLTLWLFLHESANVLACLTHVHVQRS